MLCSWTAPPMNCCIGDVRNEQGRRRALARVDLLFHAAGLKQALLCELFCMEDLLD